MNKSVVLQVVKKWVLDLNLKKELQGTLETTCSVCIPEDHL